MKRIHPLENPLDYPHREDDKVVHLETEESGVIIDDHPLVNNIGPWVRVKYPSCEKWEDIRDIANEGAVQ
jgi:hypothetical protein